MKIKHYGRYVDDMLFVHQDKCYLANIISQLQEQASVAGLRLHPDKIVLKSVHDGVYFLGQIIKPYRTYISSRTKNNFYQAIQKINRIMTDQPRFTWEQLSDIRASINSYLGIMRHANSFNLRKAMLARLIGRFYDFFIVCKDLEKVTINEDFWQWHFSANYRFTK